MPPRRQFRLRQHGRRQVRTGQPDAGWSSSSSSRRSARSPADLTWPVFVDCTVALGLDVLFGAVGALAALAVVLSAIPGGRRALQSFVGHRPIAVTLARRAGRAVPLYGISPIADDDPVRSEARIAFVSLHNHDDHQNRVTVVASVGSTGFAPRLGGAPPLSPVTAT